MTTSLFGRSPKHSFSELLKFDAIDTGVTGTLTTIVDGTGAALPLKLSTTQVAVTGTLTLAADPTAALEAATKQYVDNNTVSKVYVDAVAQGLDPKASVRVATTTNITLSGSQAVDGISLAPGDRVLVKNQTTASQNGIYVVAAGAWSRAADADTSAKVTPGMYTFVEDGTVNAATGWNLVTKSVTLDTTALVFTQFGAAVAYSAGTNVSITGSVISVPNSNIPYDIAGAILGQPTASATVFRFICVRAFTLPAGLTGSLSTAGTAATAQTVLSVKKNGTQFGTITFAASGATGTFAAASSTSFAAGDVITVVAPSSQDSTFADCQFTLVATLS